MNDQPKPSKFIRWAPMTLLIVAVLTFAFFKARPLWAHAESAQCRARLVTVGGLLKAWRGAHEGNFPADLESLGTLVPSSDPAIWACPSDPRPSSYEYYFPTGGSPAKDAVFVRCHVHGQVCLADGSVPRKAPAKGK